MQAVYKHYSREELDLQYNNRHHVPDFADYLTKWKQSSVSTTRKLAPITNVAYGSDPRERFDLFKAESPRATLVFIHGGYWHLFDKSMFHFVAEGFVTTGINTILLNYPLSPRASMGTIVRSCRQGVRWVSQHGGTLGIDTTELYLLGHSAGAHLGAMCIAQCTDEESIDIRGFFGISGLYNLLPLQRSYLNETLYLDINAAQHYSPTNYKPETSVRIALATGSLETAEYQSQRVELTEAWSAYTSSIKQFVVPEANHFSILDAATDTQSPIHQHMLSMMDLDAK